MSEKEHEEFLHAIRCVSDYALKYLEQNRNKMHQDDIDNLEASVTAIDIYGFKEHEKQNS
jgi:hypothetical protein